MDHFRDAVHNLVDHWPTHLLDAICMVAFLAIIAFIAKALGA